MHYKTLFKSGFLILTTLMLLASCDKDFNEIGSDIIGDEHFGFELYTGATVNAFNQATAAVQSNNLPLNALGIYNNPVFGKTTAGFVTQLQMAAPNPTFDPAYFVSMDSVVLTVPYFSHADATASTGYKLDSINGSGAINLKVFESGYYLSDLDPSTNFEDSQKYFTNQEGVFNSHKIGSFLNDRVNSDEKIKYIENSEFVPSAKQFVVYKRNDALVLTKTVDKTLSPRMSLHLNKEYFYQKIIQHPSGKLMNNSVFKEYFKGLYFQVSNAASNPDNGTLMRLNFSKGDITLYYTELSGFNDPDTKKDPIKYDHDNNPDTPQVPKKVIKSYVLNLQGNTVNLIDHDPTGKEYAGIIAPRALDPLPNDKKLYLKGGAGGSATIIDLFGKNDLYRYVVRKDKDGLPIDENGEIVRLNASGNPVSGYFTYLKSNAPNGLSDELDDIRFPQSAIVDGVTYYSDKERWLINEANLTFYIDNKSMASAPEPNRVFLFDVNNRRPLYDYVTDITKGLNPKLDKPVLGGVIETKDKRGVKYKVRITNHIRNLVKYADSTNVRLGLVVTESIGIVGNAKLENPVDIPYPFKSKNARVFDRIPTASVMNPLGTILFGANIPTGDPDYNNRLRLEIYYTKPKK